MKRVTRATRRTTEMPKAASKGNVAAGLETDTQGVPSRKRKRKESAVASLDFNQLPAAVQKRLLQQAQKEISRAKDADVDGDDVQQSNERLLAEDSEAGGQGVANDPYSQEEAAEVDDDPHADDELDDEELQLAAGLSSLPNASSKIQKTFRVTNTRAAVSIGKDSANHVSSGDEFGNEFECFSDDNGIAIATVDLKKSRSKPSSSVPSTPSHSSTTRSNKSHKSRIIEDDFNPLARQVAVAAKSYFRVLTVYDNPFPPQGIGRFEYGWKAIKKMANDSMIPKWKSVLAWANNDPDRPRQLVKFAYYGRSGLFSGLVMRTREKLPSFYSLGGSKATTKADVEWLIEDSHFIFGSVDLKKRTFDDAAPFNSELIVQVIQSQWFPSSNRQKADMETAARVYAERSIPVAMVLLTVTAIEHVLREWCAGTRPSVPQMFSEEAAKTSYIGFEEAWKEIAAGSATWKAQWPRKLYHTIVQDFVHLPSSSGAVKKPLPAINFDKLNAELTGTVGGQEGI